MLHRDRADTYFLGSGAFGRELCIVWIVLRYNIVPDLLVKLQRYRAIFSVNHVSHLVI